MTTPARRVLRTRLTGLAATLALIAIMAGLPSVLLAVGGIHDKWPSLDGLVGSLTRPDDGTLAVTAFVVLGWLAWLVLAGSILAEMVAALRGRTVRTIRGLAVPQGAARALVTAAALLFAATPFTTPTAAATFAATSTTSTTSTTPAITSAAPHESSAVGGASAKPDTQTPKDASLPASQTRLRPPADVGASPAAARSAAPSRTHVVRRGESLWSIAAEHLGSGPRYPEIAALNRDILGSRPDFLIPGAVLRLPALTAKTPETTERHRDATGRPYLVKRGDTLSEIADEELGDPIRYPEIFNASRDTLQPGGARLTDPDVIDVGWTLTIPDSNTAADEDVRAGGPGPTRDRSKDSRGATSDLDTTPSQEGDTAAGSTSQAGEHVPTSAPSPSPAATPHPEVPQPAAPQTPDPDAHPTAADADATTSDGTVTPVWLLTGLAGAGGVLAGSMFLALRARRRAQFRARRPGRTIAVPSVELAPVEKTVTVTGEPAAVNVEWLDEILRRLAAAQSAADEPMPQLAAVELSASELTLHLSQAQDAPMPWQTADDRKRWRLPTSTDPDGVGPQRPDQPAPYPLLVAVGSADTREDWLLNCELLTPLTITGDPTYAQDLARYLAAELACNPWSYGVTVHCVGVAEELVALNPERIRARAPAESVADDAIEDATNTLHRATDASLDVTTARAAQVGAEHWHATLLLLHDTAPDDATVRRLRTLIDDNPGMTAAAVVLTSDEAAGSGLEVRVTDDGRLTVPAVGLDLIAVGLTPDEAKGCAALLAQADAAGDMAVPVDPQADGWRSLANEAGALRDGHTVPRDSLETVRAAEHRPTSILDLRDEDYLAAAATTPEDLEILAPAVSPETRHLVEEADPDLDCDLETWFSDTCDLPRLSLLGPVRARTRGIALTKRKPYYIELLAFLATRPYGATPDELADAFSLTHARVRNDAKIVRDWLGVNPRTGRKHLPDAREAPAAKARGVGVYQVEGVLIDIDLFRRLRVRGESRGSEGVHDLRRALTLVEGRPFDRLRPGGWSWLLDGDRLDHHMLCAVVDVAHLVTTHSLTAGDHRTARAATELACLAAPYEEIPRLDLAAVATAEGHHHEAERIAREEVCGRTDEPGPPDEIPDRTQRILEQHAWLRSRQAAG